MPSVFEKDSSSVSLDLLTYTDLQSLREQKPGTGTKNIPGVRATSQLATKRYLILTYTVEFDRYEGPGHLLYMRLSALFLSHFKNYLNYVVFTSQQYHKLSCILPSCFDL